MKINFVYDFTSLAGPLVNGVDPKNIKYFFDGNLDLQNQNYIDKINKKYNNYFWVWPNSFLYQYGNTDELCTSDINDVNENELYLYPITTQGDLYDFCSLKEKKHQTKFYYISNQFKKLLKENNNFFIYIEHGMEPYFDSHILKEMYKLCESNDIPFQKLLITNGSNSNHLTLQDFSEEYPNVKHPKLVTYNWGLPLKSQDMRVALQIVDEQVGVETSDTYRSTVCDISHIKNKKEKKALLLTRRLRSQRLLFLSLMFNENIIDKTLYSLDMDLNFYPNFKYILENEIESLNINVEKKYINDILNGYQLMIKQNKKIVDYELTPYLSGFGNESKELYEKTFFSIVQETEFSVWQQAITEKVIQPIMHHHPFVLIGSPYSLKNLKRLGFKTFDKWWDESYDNEEDDWIRLKMIFDLVKNLLTKTDEEFYTILNEMKDVLEYNHNHLKIFDSEYIGEAISKKINEFTSDKNIITVL